MWDSNPCSDCFVESDFQVSCPSDLTETENGTEDINELFWSQIYSHGLQSASQY